MIPRSTPFPKSPSWRQQLGSAFTSVEALLKWLDLDPARLPYSCSHTSDFPFRVTRDFAARMHKGDAFDPLLLQVLPLQQESLAATGFVCDPVGDAQAAVTPGMLHKYHGRALLITTAACAIHCRYCFRRHFPYQQHLQQPISAETLEKLAADRVSEVILSGGDPLALSDQRLGVLFSQLWQLPDLKRLRVHTRMPVVLPSRVTPQLVELLRQSPLPVATVLHVNHPNELDDSVAAALRLLRQGASHLLNQAVLLRGINDSVETLAALCESGYETGILPYYVHLLDKVAGSAHFAVSRRRAVALEAELRNRLPGYLVPRFVTEIPGAKAKLPLAK
jgi:EF-P beta-lysylation protein EpmB